jgi:hypothetical protein
MATSTGLDWTSRACAEKRVVDIDGMADRELLALIMFRVTLQSYIKRLTGRYPSVACRQRLNGLR